MAPDDDSVLVRDARAMRGIAHPLRLRLLGELRLHGPSTATRLGERLGQSSGATSYHLRQLAAHGFVKEEPREGGGRERWWRAAHRVTRVKLTELDAETAELAGAWLRQVVAENAEYAMRALDELPLLPPQWQDASAIVDVLLRLNAEEAKQLKDEIVAVFAKYRRDTPGVPVEGAPADAAQVMAAFQLFRCSEPEGDRS